MANTVDTEIQNAVSRASGWGGAAWGRAADSVEDVDVFSGAHVLTAAPAEYASGLSAPRLPSTELSDALRKELECKLSAYFSTYFSDSDAYAAAEAWTLDALSAPSVTVCVSAPLGECGTGTTRTCSTVTGTGPKLPGAAFSEIWRKASLHVNAEGNDVSDLDLPTPVSHTFAGVAAIGNAETYSQSRVSADLWSHAASLKLRDLRLSAVLAVGEYMKALAKVDIAVMSTEVSILEAKQRASEASTAWYQASLWGRERSVERDIIALTESRGLNMHAGIQQHTAVDQLVTAAISAAESVGKIAQAASASTNSIISSSQVGF